MARSAKATRTRKGPPLQRGKIATDDARRGRGRSGAEVALFEQDDPKTAPGGVACNADTVQAAADDRKVIVRPPEWSIAFSCDVGSGSRQQNASNRKTSATRGHRQQGSVNK